MFGRGKNNPAPGYTTEPTTDPESGESVVALRSDRTGGHVTSLHGSQREADRAARRLSAKWRKLQG